MERRDKINYYLDIAEVVSQRSTCLRRHYGAVIVKNDEVDLGFCMREKLKVPRGERYELCRSVHAEQNAIISASREELIGSDIYIVGIEMRGGGYVENANSCAMCKRVIINAGIERVYIRDDKDNFRVISVNDWIENDDSLSGMFGY